MIPLTPALLVATASAFVGVRKEGGYNRGQLIEMFLREVRQPRGQPWCAAFVHHVGYWSHFDHAARKSTWPLPPTASCDALGKFAKANGILMKVPHIGDVFLVYANSKLRYVHTGIVVRVDAAAKTAGDGMIFTCATVEGNTNDAGSSNGYTTLQRIRRFNTFVGDRFIRWPELDSRLKAA